MQNLRGGGKTGIGGNIGGERALIYSIFIERTILVMSIILANNRKKRTLRI